MGSCRQAGGVPREGPLEHVGTPPRGLGALCSGGHGHPRAQAGRPCAHPETLAGAPGPWRIAEPCAGRRVPLRTHGTPTPPPPPQRSDSTVEAVGTVALPLPSRPPRRGAGESMVLPLQLRGTEGYAGGVGHREAREVVAREEESGVGGSEEGGGEVGGGGAGEQVAAHVAAEHKGKGKGAVLSVQYCWGAGSSRCRISCLPILVFLPGPLHDEQHCAINNCTAGTVRC